MYALYSFTKMSLEMRFLNLSTGNKVSEPKHYIKLVVDLFANKR